MDEKRTYNRWHLDESKKAFVSCEGVKEEVDVLDIGAGGMRVVFPRPVDLGANILGEIQIIANQGPYFIQGKVNRLTKKEDIWEAVIGFERVRTYPFEA